jgi:hypothetical protein
MDISRRLIGVSAVFSEDGKVVDVDLESLVRRLILFDCYVLHSIRLQEFPILARRLGYENLRDLLSANLIEIRCECLQLMQTAQSGIFGDPVLPDFSYQFHWIDAQKPKYVHDCLQGMHEVSGIRHKDVLRLKRSIAEAIKALPPEVRPQLFPPFQNELLQNPDLVRKAVELAIRNKLGREGVLFSLKIHQESESIFRAETDLAETLGVEKREAHKLVETGLLGVAHLTQSIGEMKAYSALNGFREEEVPLFRDKLDFLADAVSSRPRERNFQRVVEISELPTVAEERGAINVERLLKIRESREAGEFRDWLCGIGPTTDAEEIRERVAGWRALVGLRISSSAGQAIRLLATSAVGLVPHAALAALALGVFDQFIVEKVFPRSGVAAFVNELYPSLFEQSKQNSDVERDAVA